jgi:hypothetical protein
VSLRKWCPAQYVNAPGVRWRCYLPAGHRGLHHGCANSTTWRDESNETTGPGADAGCE